MELRQWVLLGRKIENLDNRSSIVTMSMSHLQFKSSKAQFIPAVYLSAMTMIVHCKITCNFFSQVITSTKTQYLL